jgi:spore maturation protein CgeB
MRLIRLCTNYPAYLAHFYALRPDLDLASFAIQHSTLMEDCFGWADFWTRHLGPLGYTVWEPVANAEPQQKAWARENNISWNEQRWLLDITLAQVRHFAPDVVLVNDYSTFDAAFFSQLRQVCPTIRLIVGWCGAPYLDGSVFHAYDLVLSNIPKLVQEFRTLGLLSHHFHHGFDTAIAGRLGPSLKPEVDFSFVGSLFKGNGMHNARERLLVHLKATTSLQIWADTQIPTLRERRRLPFRQRVYDLTRLAAALPGVRPLLMHIPEAKRYLTMSERPSLAAYTDQHLLDRCHPPLFGLDMYRRLSTSRITLNTHIDLAAGQASNMRLFEATGVGSCLLTEWQPNLPIYFKPDEEVVTYRSPEEAAEKVRYLLDHETERSRIAEAGKARTLREHNFQERAIHMDKLIRNYA